MFLQGLGDTGKGLQPFAKYLSGLPALGHIKWILPHALVHLSATRTWNFILTCSNKAAIICYRQQRFDYELVVRSPCLMHTTKHLTCFDFLPSRFDCYSFDIPNRPEDEAGLYRTVGRIKDIISAEVNDHKIPSNRIIVGGISQGSAVSLLLGLTTTQSLAGIFVLSGYVPLRKKTKEVSPFSVPPVISIVVVTQPYR
jgi:hypothetical protein